MEPPASLVHQPRLPSHGLCLVVGGSWPFLPNCRKMATLRESTELEVGSKAEKNTPDSVMSEANTLRKSPPVLASIPDEHACSQHLICRPATTNGEEGLVKLLHLGLSVLHSKSHPLIRGSCLSTSQSDVKCLPLIDSQGRWIGGCMVLQSQLGDMRAPVT